MTKEKFKEMLTKLLEIKKDEDALDSAMHKFSPDFGTMRFGRYETLVVDVIKDAVGDKYDWLGYFLYERDCKFTKKNIINDKKGKNLPFRNMDDLFNLIKGK